MSLTYDTDTVMSWSDAKSYAEEPIDKSYVSGTGPWAIRGEISIRRYRTQAEAYATFLENIYEHGQIIDFFKELDDYDKKELNASKGKNQFIKDILDGKLKGKLYL
jgi:hypothetical protein